MVFTKINGFKGLMYVPDRKSVSPKKHKCPDCFFCQACSEERCRVCKATCNEKEEKVCPEFAQEDKG